MPERTQPVVKNLDSYKKLCRIVRTATYFDILKVFKDGKSLVLEGSDIDPTLYVENSKLKTDFSQIYPSDSDFQPSA